MENKMNKRAALFIATSASFLTPVMGSSVNIALPSIGKEFGISAVLLSWIAMSYLLASAMFLVPFGRIADIYGRKRVFLYGITIYTISSLFSAVSTSAYMLIAFRIIQGIGASMIFGTGLAILVSVFPPGERGKALGINVAAVYFALCIGPFLGGFLTEHFGWRSIFYTAFPIGLSIIIFVLWKLKGEWAEARGERFDYTGAVIYGLSLVSLIFGFSLLPEIIGLWLVLIGILGMVAFSLWETKNDYPILDIRIFKNNRIFAFSNLAALINYSATTASGFLLSLFLQYIKGYSPMNAGLILVAQPIVQTVLSPFAGRISDKIEPRIVASIGMMSMFVGLFLFTFIDENSSIGFITIRLAILGLSFALFSSPNANAIMSSVEKRLYGVASGILGTMRLTGHMLSMGIAMIVFSIYIGNAPITPENFPLFIASVKTLYIIMTIICFFGIFASLARGSTK